MSIPVVKWIPGAPKQLKVGMVVKIDGEVLLVGSTLPKGFVTRELLLSKVESHGQLVDAYVLEWLGNDGIVKGVSR